MILQLKMLQIQHIVIIKLVRNTQDSESVNNDFSSKLKYIISTKIFTRDKATSCNRSNNTVTSRPNSREREKTPVTTNDTEPQKKERKIKIKQKKIHSQYCNKILEVLAKLKKIQLLWTCLYLTCTHFFLLYFKVSLQENLLESSLSNKI